jgi:hypothetical protein
VFVVVSREGQRKGLDLYRMVDGQLLGRFGDPFTFSDSRIGLASTQGALLVSEFDTNAVRMITDPLEVGEAFRLPTQVGPTAIAVTANRQLVVLNQVSNTLTVADRTATRPEFVFPSAELAAYRSAALNAFADLLGGFLQYLKDCLCGHFLVAPPQPTGAEKLRLGSVTIRGGQVYKICNFTGRRYVTSFPTIGYWLSLVPIQPLIARAVEAFCCTVVPEYFSKFDGGRAGDDRFSAAGMLRLVEWAQGNDLLSSVRDVRSRSAVAAKTAALAVQRLTPAVPPPGGPTVPLTTLVGQPAARVAESLTERGITVHRARFDPRLSTDAIGTVAGMFRTPQPGQEVTLCEEDGVVRFFNVSSPSPLAQQTTELLSTVAAQAEELQELRRTVVASRELLSTRLAQARAELDRRDQTLAELHGRLEAVEHAQRPTTEPEDRPPD